MTRPVWLNRGAPVMYSSPSRVVADLTSYPAHTCIPPIVTSSTQSQNIHQCFSTSVYASCRKEAVKRGWKLAENKHTPSQKSMKPLSELQSGLQDVPTAEFTVRKPKPTSFPFNDMLIK